MNGSMHMLLCTARKAGCSAKRSLQGRKRRQHLSFRLSGEDVSAAFQIKAIFT